MSIAHDNEIDFEEQFEVNPKVKHIKLSKPIFFDPGYYYYITVEPSVSGYPCEMIDDGVNEALQDKLILCNEPDFTLIDRLYFEELPKN